MRIYNSLTRSKEEFVPLEKDKVKMYACGITVSGDAHIGHAIQAMVFDIIRKYLEKKGYDVTYARNYTDVDDKIIANALKLGVNPLDFAKANIVKIDNEMEKLGVDKATLTLKATETISQIIEFITKLIEKGYAYTTKEGDVYYDVEKFKDYGKLSNRNLEDAKNGVRVELLENKHSPLDFALWKSAKPNEIYWESPWGKGRPGWHIECSAMNYYNLGEQIDIHGGGRDLIFPHHENEIAQTEALTGKQFAKYWIHNGLVKINGQKMSKSLGNGITLQELLDKYDNEVIRFALLQTNYKNDINIVDGLFDEAEKQLYNFYVIINNVEKTYQSDKISEFVDKEFNECMDDDFNTSKAISNLFGYFKQINNKLKNNDATCIEDVNAIKQTYNLLGLFKHNAEDFINKINNKNNSKIPDEVLKLANERWIYKRNKDYIKADELRNKLLELGYNVKDSKDGYNILKI